MNDKKAFNAVLAAGGLCLLVVAEGFGFDLAADRGRTIETLRNSFSADYYVYNVDSPMNPGSDWSVPSVSGTPWFRSQFRTATGKKVGLTSQKVSSAQFDFSAFRLNNNWFNPGGSLHPNCCGITPGWQDTYTNCPLPSMTGGSDGFFTTGVTAWVPPPSGSYSLHIRNDPTNRYSGDKNPLNNQMWYTGTWVGNTSVPEDSRFSAVDHVDLPGGTYTLAQSDSIFVGPYSTDPNQGRITLSQSSTYNLTAGNQMIGYQGKQMKMIMTGGKKATYVIKSGSKVAGMFAISDQYSNP